MSEWKEVRLGDIVTVKSGYAYKGKYISNKGKNILLGMGCVSYNDKFLYSGARAYDEDCDERYCAKAGDIVLATRQQSDSLPILAMPAIIPDSLFDKKIIVGTNLYLIKNDSDIDNHFLFWLLKTPNYVNYISSVKTGTTVRMVTKKDVENYIFKCPSKEERDTISNILWGIDAKIETNNKLNDKLEEMAQAIFKSWFVDFEPFKDKPFHETELGMIPEGWEVGSILDIAELFDSQRKPLSSMEREYMKGKYPYYGATSIMDYIDKYIFDGTYLLMGEDGSVVKENGNPYLQYVWGKFWPNNHAHVMQGRNGYSTEMLYCLLSITDVSSIVTGAVQMKISQRSMSRLLTVIPSKSVCNKFNTIIRPIFDIIKRIWEENDRLASLRDTLLPRLMSGELIV